MEGPGQLPQHTVPALPSKLAEVRKFKSNFISFLVPLLRNTPMKIYFVLTCYHSNAKRGLFFFHSHPQEFLIYFLFLFLQSGKSQEEPPGPLQLLEAAYRYDPGLSPACEQNPSKRAPCGTWGVQTGTASGASGLVLQQTCNLLPISPSVSG